MSSRQSSKETAACASCSTVQTRTALRAAPCGHCYCSACLKRMARLALKDRALVPVRCCRKELPVEAVAFALSLSTSASRCKGDLALYQQLVDERRHAWSSSELVSDAEYATSVARVGAKQCPGCGVGVLRDFGCVHMKCPNGHEFCFSCLQLWGVCRCPLIPDLELRAILGE